jgi:hypothetical protein
VEQFNFPIWSALGTCLHGMADAELGRTEEGLAQVNEGIAQYQQMRTPPVFWPQLVAINAGGARACRQDGGGTRAAR